MKIIVFVEKVFRYTNTDNKVVHYLLMDFPSQTLDRENFFGQMNLEYVQGKSMLEVLNITFEQGGIPREGRYYVLPEKFLNEGIWEPVPDLGDFSSNYVALRMSKPSSQIKFNTAELYNKYVQRIPLSNIVSVGDYLDTELQTTNKLKIEVFIHNVGQGNWNEVVFNNNLLLVYDLGASNSPVFIDSFKRVCTKSTRKLKIDSVLSINRKQKKILIISHWDIDHYNGIFELADLDIKSFDVCLVPDSIENESTQRAFDKLQKFTKVHPITMNSKGRGRGATSVLTEIYNSSTLKIYKGTNCSDRNKRGILLSLHGNNTDFILPADHHYNQIDKFIIPNCKTKDLNLVVPHHGGNAGDFRKTRAWKNGNHVIISSGNKFGHPFPHIVAELNSNFAALIRTDSPLDYYRVL